MPRTYKPFSFPYHTDGRLDFPFGPDGKRLCWVDSYPHVDSAMIQYGSGHVALCSTVSLRYTLKLGDTLK